MSPRNPASPATVHEVRALREDAGLSQADLAAQTGYSQKTIARWEAGEGTPRKAVIEYLRGLLSSPRTSVANPKFKFVDLFAGIGGLRLGFESIGGECVFTSEWDRHCQISYRMNFGIEHPIAGDIIQVPSELIPKHEVLLAGFPCQPFSIAGVSKKNALGRPHGFACDTQGTLFFEVARILKYHRPKAFLLENVKNLTTHDRGRTFRTIMDVLVHELQYNVHYKVVDAKSVVPQHRERIFIVGFADPVDFNWDDLDLPEPNKGPKLRTILHPTNGDGPAESPYTDSKGRPARKYVLSDHLWEYLQAYAAKHKGKGNGFGFGLVGPSDVARTLSARYYKDGSEILIRRGRGNPRRLTPRECARLMGFDRPEQEPFRIVVSDTQAYKQFGNAVVVPVVEAVARSMRPHILGETVQRDQLSLPLRADAA